MQNDMYKSSGEAEPVNLEINFGQGDEENVASVLEGPKKSIVSEVSYVDQKSNGSIDEMTVEAPSVKARMQRKPDVPPLEVIEDIVAADDQNQPSKTHESHAVLSSYQDIHHDRLKAAQAQDDQ